MARVYATAADYQTYTGQTPPADINRKLIDATRMLEAEVFRLCYYTVDDTTGLPTDTAVAQAFTDAVCAQVQWWEELGDQLGAIGVGWGEVRIGSVMLNRGDGKPAARMVAPQAMDALRSPDLTPDKLRIGMVVGW